MEILNLQSRFPFAQRYDVVWGPLSEGQLADIYELECLLFTSPNPPQDLLHKMKQRKNLLSLLVYGATGTVIAYKIGYEKEAELFYSWLGGVHPDFRRMGLAQFLMDEQHHLAREKGFSRVRTHSSHEFPAMLKLNEKSGFQLVGTVTAPDGKERLVFERELT